MSFQQPPLPYGLDALRPFLGEEQMTYHYGKHHAAYFKKLNAPGRGQAGGRVCRCGRGGPVAAGRSSTTPPRPGTTRSSGTACRPPAAASPRASCCRPSSAISADLDDFKKEFSEKAANLFGSGWTWLAADKQGKLEIMPLGNADTPLKHDREPILTLDVWEHAYYIDYRNERPRFIEGFWTQGELGLRRQVPGRAGQVGGSRINCSQRKQPHSVWPWCRCTAACRGRSPTEPHRRVVAVLRPSHTAALKAPEPEDAARRGRETSRVATRTELAGFRFSGRQRSVVLLYGPVRAGRVGQAREKRAGPESRSGVFFCWTQAAGANRANPAHLGAFARCPRPASRPRGRGP